jgi:pimeloyl-ACP methyl ester carboxylesterase
MASIELGDHTVAFRREGRGPVVLLIHGFVADGAATWRDQLEGLSDAYTLVAPDLPGSGGSSRPPDSWRVPEIADLLAEFAAASGIGRAHVIGLSFGGTLALELFRRHSGLVRSLVLADAYAGWAGSLSPEEVTDRLALSIRASHLPSSEFVAALLPSMFSTEAAPERVAAFAASVAEFDPPAFRTMATAAAEADLRDVLPTVDVPTLLLYGDKDVRAPRDVALRMKAGIAHARLVFLPGVGHASSVEDPEGFNREVRTFLDVLIQEPL